MRLLEIADELSEALSSQTFSAPVTHVYNPLVYARAAHAQYIEKYGQGPRPLLLFGMNPGPWGMAQTGVPFGEVNLVRDWLGLDAEILTPTNEHPKRPIMGWSCHRSEVSGRRLWGWLKERFGTPEALFSRVFVANYCPLSFMEESGRNRTPDRLKARERQLLYPPCDAALRATVEYLQPRYVLGVGQFAETRARLALDGLDVTIGRLPHPSPANPQSNRGWATLAEAALAEMGIDLMALPTLHSQS